MASDFLFVAPESALDLTIKGSIGEFAVHSRDSENRSIRVQYMETHVGFATSGDSQERLLQQLAPVREVFNISELSFDELMQRDIDDARVSTELIPYLLEDRGDALVKLFPPIIVVILPTGPGGRPEPTYPKVEYITEPDPKHDGIKWKITRSGPVGAEAFEFKQMIDPQGHLLSHDYSQLRLNTTRCKLAIVDGQHRAMALLALYRNYKEWPKDTSSYQSYYRRWARSEIEKFDLSQVNLPVLLCTFPTLHSGDSTQKISTTQACRSVFLALNKNARPVSKARNHLLNDGDIIAHFLRDTLSEVKQLDTNSPMSIRIWNFELDAEGDKRTLTNPMSISGVIHLYSTIEFLMLNRKNIVRLNHPKQNLWKLKSLNECIDRLQARDLLGSDRTSNANRLSIDRDTARILTKRYRDRYGKLILRGLDRFGPFYAHSSVSLQMETKLRSEAYGSTYHSILFEGQSKKRVFESYLDSLKSDISNAADTIPPAIQASYEDFKEKRNELENRTDRFYLERAIQWFAKVPEKFIPDIVPVVQDLYKNTFTTEAFQIALFTTFFAAVEWLGSQDLDRDPPSDSQVSSWFDQYIENINGFFIPDSPKAAWDIIRVFYGEVSGGYGATPPEISRTTSCLKKLLVPGELKPDEWPKFRYILLEVWAPENSQLLEYVQSHRHQLRSEAVTSFEESELRHTAKRKGILTKDLSDDERNRISRESRKTFCKALGYLGVKVTPEQLDKDVSEDLKELSTEDDDTAYSEDEDDDDSN